MTATTEGLRGEWMRVLLDLMPSPLLLIEPETAEVAFANAAALRLADGRLPIAAHAGDGYALIDAEGAPLPPERMPDVRAARGERIQGLQLDWRTPAGARSLLVSADTVPPILGQTAAVVLCFEDVSGLKGAETRVREQAEEIGRLYRAAREAERRKDESLALLDTLFASAPVGLSYYDRELRYVRVNEALARINGLAPADHIGRTPAQVLPGLPHIEDSLRRVLETGEPTIELEVSGETPAAPGELRHWLSSHYPVRDSAGAVIGVGTVVHDITERKRAEQERAQLLAAEQAARARAEHAEQRWAFLARATALLGDSLDHEETMRRLAEIVVPAKADWCALHVLQPDGRIQLLAVSHVEPERERLAWEAHRRWPATVDDAGGIGAVIRTGRAEHYPEVDEDLLRSVAGGNEEQLEVLRRLGFASAIVVPLELHGRTLGSLALVMERGRRFDDDDLELATELARRVAVAVENARLYRERSEIAQTLQRSLLPPHLPDIPGFEVAARYRAAGEGFEVGGDFYDLFDTSSGRWTAVIGDVCGKGPEAAALTSLARHTVRAAAADDPLPSRVLDRLNDAILRANTGERFMTVACAALERAGELTRVEIACGGHPPALVLHADGSVAPVGVPGMLLGLGEDARLVDARVELRPGDALVLYTDGVSDPLARDGAAGTAALAEIVAGCAGLGAPELAARIEDVVAGPGGERPRDDLALLVLRAR